MNYRIIFRVVGRILMAVAAFMLPAMIISFCYGEMLPGYAFLGTIVASGLCGFLLSKIKQKSRNFYAREGFVTVGLAWIVVSLFGALPFFFSGEIPNFVDALFETVSGFTTTGASILPNVEAMSHGLLYWRSFTHWLGGMGVLVFVLALGPVAGGELGDSLHLLRAESPGPQVSKLVPRMQRTAKILYGIYIVLTLIQVVLLLIGRMPVLDAVTTTFGTAGTGGFSIRANSLGAYSPYCQTVTTVFMILFGVNFSLYYLLLMREVRAVLRSEELRLYLITIFAATLIITLNILSAYGSFGEAFHHAIFQVASIITTTGFATADFNAWPELSRAILLLLMFMGACAGSTGGGLKVSRVLLAFKSARRSVHRTLRPNSVKLVHMDGELVEDSTVSEVQSYFLIYFFIMAFSVLIVSLDNFSFETSFSAVAACLNNVGPGLDVVGPTGNFASLSLLSKLVLIFDMLLGRLELYPILILFAPAVWKK
ncbi:MAG: TrkH family potassium uptake protein [Ruminococcaceae bacterium]|nr:TrkH family potassium uptake protein [Oscillospiraceae bacterium]